MGLFTKIEDRPTPSAVYNWRVYACAALAGSAAIMIGKVYHVPTQGLCYQSSLVSRALLTSGF